MSKRIKELYRKAGLKPPNGKGIHTEAFHKCVISIKKKQKQGKTSKSLNPYAVCMSSLGKKKAIKKKSLRTKNKRKRKEVKNRRKNVKKKSNKKRN